MSNIKYINSFLFHLIPGLIVSLIVSLLSNLAFNPPALGLEIHSELRTGADGTISKTINLSCDKSDQSLCLNACSSTFCIIEEPTCTNCIGTGSELLRILFTKPGQHYTRNNQNSSNPEFDSKLVDLIIANLIVIIEPQSLFNLYTSISKKESLPPLLELCPAGASNTAIAVILDESGFPEQAITSFCDFPDGKQQRFGLSPLSEQSLLLPRSP